MSILKRQVSSSSTFVPFFTVMTHNSSVNFNVINFLLWAKSSSFDIFKCSGENLPNSLCNFPSNKSVFLQILHHSSVSWEIIPRYFFNSNNIYFAQKKPIKMKIFETFKCSSQNLSNSLSQFWNDKSIPLQILRNSSLSWQITPLWILSSHFFKFGLKDPIKIPILCPGKKLLYSSCHFPDEKSVESNVR